MINEAASPARAPQFAPYFVAGVTIYLIRRYGPRLPLWALLAAHDHTGLPVPGLIVAVVLVLLVAAWLVHHLVERPVGPALRRWIATGSIRLPRIRDGRHQRPAAIRSGQPW